MAAITRRQVLLGAGATLAAGAAAAIEAGVARRNRVLHGLGLASSPDHSVKRSGTELLSGRLSSTHMPRPVGWTVSVPSGALAGVVYCLHGRNEDHRYAFDTIRLHDEVAAAGAPIAVAAVSGGSHSYWHRRADGSDAMAMLIEDFIPMIETRVATTSRAILGWSMGGYGALLAAETWPERFRAVVAASPALWTSPGSTAPGAFDGPADFRRHDVFAKTSRLASVRVRVDCGTSDPFYGATKRFVAGLPGSTEGTFGRGFHDAAYWRSVAPAQVRTLQEALA